MFSLFPSPFPCLISSPKRWSKRINCIFSLWASKTKKKKDTVFRRRTTNKEQGTKSRGQSIAILALTVESNFLKMAEFLYEGIVLTSIDVVESPTPSSPRRVTFSLKPRGKRDDTTAVFIHKIKDVTVNGEELLEAEKLEPGEVQDMINAESDDIKEKSTDPEDATVNRKVLFTIHGFNVEPRGYLLQVKGVEIRFRKFKLIPVLWPSKGNILAYLIDRSLSKAAGRAFKSIYEPTKSFSKSLIAHSMGNRVLRNFASEAFNFDNIFMVAADTDGRMFYQSYIEAGDQEWRKDGLRIKDMLTDGEDGGKKGKIHVVYNRKDSPSLLASTILNMKPRLGKVNLDDGCFCYGPEKIHDDIYDYLVNKDWTSDASDSHNYQFDWGLAAYMEEQYEKTLNGIV